MSELEAATIAFQEATIAYQNASLAIQEAGLAIQQSGLTATYVQAGIAGVIGGLQCGLIHVGLRRMGEASAERTAQHDETMQVLQNQHTENMVALRTLIERSTPSRQ